MKKIVTAFLLFSFSINLANSLEGSKVSNSRIKMLNGKYAKLSKYYETWYIRLLNVYQEIYNLILEEKNYI